MNIFGAINPELSLYTGNVGERVILFDPSGVYSRISINKYERYQSGLSLCDMFPALDGICACGCKKELSGRRKKWATDDCSSFAFGVFSIIRGGTDYVRRLMQGYLEYKCCKCGCENYIIEAPNSIFSGLQVDHILAVQNGGGGCWLGNYQFICHRCHSVKTTGDNQIRNKPKQLPLSNIYI